jgi:hypothetical protein
MEYSWNACDASAGYERGAMNLCRITRLCHDKTATIVRYLQL